MGDTTQIGYMPTRSLGLPDHGNAAEMGLVLKSVPDDQLDAEVEVLAARMVTVPINQLAMQKMVINSAVEEKIKQTQRNKLQSPR